MKKLRLLGIAGFMTLALAGCQNTSDREAALEDQIAQLEQQITSLENEKESTSVSSGETASVENNSKDDTLETLTKAVNDAVKKAEDAKANGSNEENQKTFFKIKGELQDVENRLESYEDKIEDDFRQGNLSYEKARDEEIKVERLEDKLDDAEDRLENLFGYDD